MLLGKANCFNALKLPFYLKEIKNLSIHDAWIQFSCLMAPWSGRLMIPRSWMNYEKAFMALDLHTQLCLSLSYLQTLKSSLINASSYHNISLSKLVWGPNPTPPCVYTTWRNLLGLNTKTSLVIAFVLSTPLRGGYILART